jgi:hypothetical protein
MHYGYDPRSYDVMITTCGDFEQIFCGKWTVFLKTIGMIVCSAQIAVF